MEQLTPAGSSSRPLVSVVIPTRDRPVLLARCLDRLAPGAQSLAVDQYEVVVTDDGGGSETRGLLEARYPWVRWTAGPRRGPAANRNAGARAALGAWIVFTDDDTIPDHGWLAELVGASVGVDVVEGRTICSAGLHSPREHAPVNETGGWWWSCNIAVRRDVFDRLGGFDERFRVAHMEDVDFRERARAIGITARFSAAAVVDHPPRREQWGTAWESVHRAEALFSAIHRQQKSLVRTLVTIARVRARTVARSPFSADALSALLSVAIELVHVSVNWRRWNADARTIAAAPR